jgi:hypothetical protein
MGREQFRRSVSGKRYPQRMLGLAASKTGACLSIQPRGSGDSRVWTGWRASLADRGLALFQQRGPKREPTVGGMERTKRCCLEGGLDYTMTPASKKDNDNQAVIDGAWRFDTASFLQLGR